jgi:hypothetical protein
VIDRENGQTIATINSRDLPGGRDRAGQLAQYLCNLFNAPDAAQGRLEMDPKRIVKMQPGTAHDVWIYFEDHTMLNLKPGDMWPPAATAGDPLPQVDPAMAPDPPEVW